MRPDTISGMSRGILRTGIAAMVLAVGWSSLSAATIRGTVTIREKRGKTGDPSSAVVYLDQLPDGASSGAAPGRFTIDTRKKRFLPDVLPVPVGAVVSFPNFDTIQHNAFSVSGDNRFDLGLYGKGDGKEVTLRRTGVVRVYCNVHPQMAAVIVVCPNRHFARVRADGTFELGEAPGGRYEVVVWDPRGGTRTKPVTVEASGSADVSFELDASSFRSEPHLDKEGKPYGSDEESYRE